MAVNLSNASSYLERTTNVVVATSNYTCIFWARFNGGTASSYSAWFVTLDDPAVYNTGTLINTDTGLYDMFLNAFEGATSLSTSSQILADTVWYPVAYVRNGTTHSFYINGILVGSITVNFAGQTLGWVGLGNDTYSTDTRVLQFYNFREWNVALTLAQINAEINSPSAVVHSSGLQTYTPLTSDLLDISGNGNNWTAVGAPTFVADPTFPANLSSSTAIALTGPGYTASQNVLVGAYAFTVWYKYLSVIGDNVFNFLGYGDASIYKPSTNVYNNSVAISINGTANCAIQYPVQNIGDTYYFQIVPNSPSLLVANLSVSLVKHVDVTAPFGTPAISNDADTNDGYHLPLALVDPNSDAVLKFINPFPVGESGAVLINGTKAVGNEDANSNIDNVYIFDNTWTQIAVATLPSVCLGLTSDNTTQFYVLYNTSGLKVRTLSTAGALGSTIYAIPGAVKNIAVNPANTILYFQLNNNNTIKQWDLIGNMAMADLVSGGTETLIPDLLCLTDGSIITMNVVGQTIKHYKSDGTLLATWTPPIAWSSGNRIATDNIANLWIYASDDGTLPLSLFKLVISSGAVIVNQSHTVYENALLGTASATPVRFGPSSSCPLLIDKLATTASTIVIGKASNPLASGVTFTVTGPAGNFNITTDTSPGWIINVAPGTYSIVEQTNVGYNPSYFVSNDPVNNNNTAIVVGTSELVDVVVLNTLSQKYGGLYTLVPSKQQDTLRNQDGSTVLKMINWFFELFTDRDK